MKILVVCSYLPYPLFSGGQVRLYNLIKELSNKHEITLICEKRANQTVQDTAEVKKICKEVITIDRKKQWSIANIVKAGISSHSFLVTGHTQAVFKQKIQECLDANSFDLIHVETYYVMQNLQQTNIPIVLVEHNIEYQVYEKFKKRAPALLRPLLNVDILKIRNEEEHFWKKANALIAVSHEDQIVMQTAGCKPYLVSNGVNTNEFTFKEKSLQFIDEKKLLFIGDFKWIQNQDSIQFIIKEIWPKIKESEMKKHQRENIKLWIVSSNIPYSIRSLTNDPDVLFDQESSARPTPEIFQEATVLIAPIRVGGGTSYKILESMSCGTPVVTMSMSAAALDAKDGRDIIVGQNAADIAEKTVNLITNNEKYRTISSNGRELVERNYTWQEIGKKLDEAYHKAMLY
jgi:glycosyltransferase involved in cell wall biosynthesis